MGYSSILGSRVPVIKPAQTTQGLFYHVYVGPFQNSQEAVEFCVRLKDIVAFCIPQQIARAEARANRPDLKWIVGSSSTPGFKKKRLAPFFNCSSLD